jgi:hypothetical protein
LKLKHDEPLSRNAFKFNLRRYNERMLETEEMHREERRTSRRAALLESERPFTFYHRAKVGRCRLTS